MSSVGAEHSYLAQCVWLTWHNIPLLMPRLTRSGVSGHLTVSFASSSVTLSAEAPRQNLSSETDCSISNVSFSSCQLSS